MRSYQHYSTGSHQNAEVKRAWARVVLGWVTSWEFLVLHSFFFDFVRFDSQTVVNILRASSHSSIRNQRCRARRGGKTFARGRGAGPTCGFSTSRYRDKRKHWWQGVVRMWSWYNFRVIKCVVKVVVCPMWLAGPMCCSVGLSNASRRWYDQCISGVVVRIGNGE